MVENHRPRSEGLQALREIVRSERPHSSCARAWEDLGAEDSLCSQGRAGQMQGCAERSDHRRGRWSRQHVQVLDALGRERTRETLMYKFADGA